MASPVVVSHDPYNAEAALSVLGTVRTPVDQFYTRNHFPIPELDEQTWRLTIDGAIARAQTLTLEDLRSLPARTITATMECAGNGRTGLAPLPAGEPWGQGAVSTTDWRGVPLRVLVERAGLDDAAVELRFTGADQGVPSGSDGEQPYIRSLPRAAALLDGVLLAFEMGGQPLPRTHGGPVRLLVPDWYGMASVKWLVQVTAVTTPYAGHFQHEAYVLRRPGQEDEPLRQMLVKSLITNPAAGAVLPPGTHRITGVAWSGHAPVARVEVSTRGGDTWQPAELVGDALPHTWRPWTFTWQVDRPGRYALRARATDAAGNIQPHVPEWNVLGYANNAVQLVLVEIRP